MEISNLTGKSFQNVQQFAISEHLIQCNCTIYFDNFDILATDASKFKLLLTEIALSLFINHARRILNRSTKLFPSELFD